MERLNSAIAGGAARLAVDGGTCEPLEEGLAAADGTGFYPVVGGVPHLVPARRIVQGESATVSQPRAERELAKGWAARWADLSLRWDELGPPERPAKEDTEFLERLVAEACAAAGVVGPRVLMLGVTPETATMRWPSGTRLLALDFCDEMIRRVWPARASPPGGPVLADWLSMPVADGSYDLVVGDGVLTPTRYPDGCATLLRQARRVLRDRGVLALRFFTRPEAPEPVERVFARLRAGEFRSLDAMKWRLVASLHDDATGDVRMGDVWDAWEANVPEPAALMRSLGFPDRAPRIFEGLRGVEARATFPTLAEVRALLAREFQEVRCMWPRYEDGERYPTMLLWPKEAAPSC